MTRYINLAEFFVLAEQVTGLNAAILVKVSRTDLADSAPHASAARLGDEDVPLFAPQLSGTNSGNGSSDSVIGVRRAKSRLDAPTV